MSGEDFESLIFEREPLNLKSKVDQKEVKGLFLLNHSLNSLEGEEIEAFRKRPQPAVPVG